MTAGRESGPRPDGFANSSDRREWINAVAMYDITGTVATTVGTGIVEPHCVCSDRSPFAVLLQSVHVRFTVEISGVFNNDGLQNPFSRIFMNGITSGSNRVLRHAEFASSDEDEVLWPSLYNRMWSFN
ncbi:hypothetical protein GWI33_022760 [Rhynchophorus ferrugineus]|uniref:Uncharacterized protein n=1 Tax=Rhynchophorus ferrugineus TaxID=354439 RepID=A0A834MHM2_RHYFE|nr:hypothetical protein GWI33_022760 [Rhynchophorus ferrugineus]